MFAVLSGQHWRLRKHWSGPREVERAQMVLRVLQAPRGWPLHPFPLRVSGECGVVINCLFSNDLGFFYKTFKNSLDITNI